MDRDGLARALVAIAEEAGVAILDVYAGDFESRSKQDQSPVTDADERAEAIILDRLQALAPEIPVVAEERAAAGRIPDISGGCFFLVDPLDGTREFIRRNGEFTVNIALVEQGAPTLGAVHLPALAQSYWGAAPGLAFRRQVGASAAAEAAAVAISVKAPDPSGLVAVASRSHRDARTEQFLQNFPIRELIPAGSSLKLCRIAEGAADIYPRLGATMEWDIAAGHAVLAAAGGSVRVIEGGETPGEAGQPLRYGKPGFRNPFFVARGG